MADERNEDQFGETEGKNSTQQPAGQQGQQPIAQQGQPNEAAKQGEQTDGLGSDPTMSGQGPSPDLGGQSSSGQTQSDTDTLTDQSGGLGQGGTGGSRDEGFIGSKGTGADDSLLERGKDGSSASSAEATGGSDFARQGRGAPDDKDEDESGAGGSGSPGGI